jgi:hypothetical protein
VNTFIAANKRRALTDAHRLAEKHRALSAQHRTAFDIATLEEWLDSEHVRSLRAAALAAERGGKRGRALRLQGAALTKTRSADDLRTLVGLVLGAGVRRLLRRDATYAGAGQPVPSWLAEHVRKEAH